MRNRSPAVGCFKGHQSHVSLLIGVQAVGSFGFLCELGDDRDEHPGGGQSGYHARFIPRSCLERTDGGDIPGVGRSVVVFEVVDFGVITGKAPAGPGLAGRITGSARPRQGSGDMPRQVPLGGDSWIRAGVGHGAAAPGRSAASGGRRRRGLPAV